MELIKHNSIIKGISKKFNLTFCNIHKYYEGNAYVNDKGETLPTYFGYGARVYKLAYIDGCFNPFLVDVTNEIDKKISDAQSRSFMAKNQADKDRANNYAEYLLILFN